MSQESLAAPAGRASLRAPLLIAVIAGGTFLAPVNSTMIAVALPSLAHDFGIAVGTASWIVTAYLVVIASLQPVAGRLGDLLGHRHVFLAGCAGLALSSVACALAPSFETLVVFRALQAAAAAVMVPNGAAIIRHALPAQLRARAFGWFAACMTLGAALGPALGGVLVDAFGWASIFWVNLPVLGLVLPLAFRLLPETERDARAAIDVGGALGLTLVLVAGVATLATLLRTPAAPVALGAATVALLAALIAWERRQRHPIINVKLFHHPAFAGASATVLLSNLVMYTTLLLVPIFMVRIQQHGPATAGWLLVVYSGSMSLLSPVGGYLSDRFGAAFPAVAGAALQLTGTALLLRIDAGTTLGALAAYLAVGAAGVGLQMGVQQSAALESAPARMAGAAGGVWATARYVGSIAGAALLGVLITGTPTVAEVHDVLWVLAAAGILLVPLGLMLRFSGRPLGLLTLEREG